jgi:hypothetical protein
VHEQEVDDEHDADAFDEREPHPERHVKVGVTPTHLGPCTRRSARETRHGDRSTSWFDGLAFLRFNCE